MAKSSKHILLASALALGAFASAPASAGCDRSATYLGSICIVGFSYCPRGYVDADGRLLQISQNSALFSLYGTIYGGNGRTDFAVPDLRGRAPVGVNPSGLGGLERVREGQRGGREGVDLSLNQIPAHHHSVKLLGTDTNGNTDKPSGAVLARLPRSKIYSAAPAASEVGAMGPSAVSQATQGGGQPVQVRDPYMGLRYCVAIQGFYPSRN